MTVRIELDAIERRHLVCEGCFPVTGKLLDRAHVRRQWILRCTACNQEWTEQSIRAGKAVGIRVLDR